jgi:hypothetical protein
LREKIDQRKGAWFVALIILALLTVPVFPPLGMLFLGAIAMLFLL